MWKQQVLRWHTFAYVMLWLVLFVLAKSDSPNSETEFSGFQDLIAALTLVGGWWIPQELYTSLRPQIEEVAEPAKAWFAIQLMELGALCISSFLLILLGAGVMTAL